jgi:CDP-paratose 2-epimerase
MNVLITGGCGFLGSNIAKSYLEKGDRVTVIDALYRKGAELNLEWLFSSDSHQKIGFYKIDLADSNKVNEVFLKEGSFDYICHLGGQVAMTSSLIEPRRDMLTNVVGTFNILEAVRQFCPDALVAYSSTNKVYGDLEWLEYKELEKRFCIPEHPNGLDESIPLDFASPYGCSKGAADQYVRDWHRNFGLKTVIFRHSSIFGGRQFATFDQGWVGWFCQKAVEHSEACKNGKLPPTFTISGSGKQVRDVLHAQDLVNLYHTAYENADKVAGKIFNIGGGIENSLSLLELFDLLEELTATKTPMTFERLPRRQSDQDYFIADTTLIRKTIGWIPQVSAKEGITNMINWTRGNLEK